MTDIDRDSGPTNRVTAAFERVREHAFHPLDEDRFTIDRELGEHGIADLADGDWRVRLLAVRDLVRAGADAVGEIATGLADDDVQVCYVAATALGVLRADGAVPDLKRVVREDPDPLARSAATVALGRIAAEGALDLLRNRAATDESKDVRHQAELAVDRIEKGAAAEDELVAAYRSLDPDAFRRLSADDEAPEFSLPTVEGEEWSLSDHVGDGWTVLIWVFADWCPVCHREFDELIELREAFAEADVSVATVECHERYRGSVMVGRELEPEYWFADEPFVEAYTEQIWWPHLLDRAGAVGARYGVDPMAFAVHAEYINRPATVVIDPSGTVRFAYYGTFWGDRPSVKETLEMIRTEEFEFEHEERRRPPSEENATR